jgi:hypothetical protein
MSNGEKLYSGKCHLHGFGKCEVSDEPRPDKRSMSKLRRRKTKTLIRLELREWQTGSETYPRQARRGR